MRRLPFLHGVLIGAVICLGACTTPRDATPTPARTASPPATPTGLAWRQLAAAPSARTEVAATVSGTRIYVAGGYRGDGGTVATVEVFDTGGGRWERGPDLPIPVNHAMAATVGSDVYVFGGFLGNGKPDAAVFRLAGDGWRPVARMPQPRAAATAVAVDNRVYIAGGVGPGGLASQMLVYDAAADRWSTAPGPPTKREHLGGAGFGGLVYTVGGRTGGPDGNLDAFEAYDPRTGQWTRLAPLPTRRGGLAATATCAGQVVAVGGEEKATFPEAEAYDVRTGTWRSLPPLPTPRHGLGVVARGATVYTVAGGPKPGLDVANSNEAIDLTSLGSCP